MIRKTIKMVVAFIVIIGSVTAKADDNINYKIKEFVTQNLPVAQDESIDVKINPAGSTISLPKCIHPITISLPDNSNFNQMNAVKLSCDDLHPWKILMPIEVFINTKVMVAKHTISAKEVIQEDDLEYALYNRNKLYNGFYKNKEEIVGKVASQVITAGAVLTKSNTQLPILVHRDELVDLIARNNTISVMTKGVAKGNGSLNQTIKVYNSASKRTLDAVVIGQNQVEVI